MGDFDNVCFVWGENVSTGPLTGSPSVTVALWPEVLGCDWYRWPMGGMPHLDKYDVILVNLFPTYDSTHIEQIKRAYPEKFVVAMPDPPLDQVLAHPNWVNMWRQMAFADMIGGRTYRDCHVYGSLLNKPTHEMPSPAGPEQAFKKYRDSAKKGYIITQDHPWTETYATAQNVAALALIQRQHGLDVVYCSAFDHTKSLANMAGLKAQWIERLDWPEMIEMTAQANLSVDLYAQHSYHRHAMLCRLVGTPIIGSDWTEIVSEHSVDPMNPVSAAQHAGLLLWSRSEYELAREMGYRQVEATVGFESSRQRVRLLLDKVKGLQQHA